MFVRTLKGQRIENVTVMKWLNCSSQFRNHASHTPATTAKVIAKKIQTHCRPRATAICLTSYQQTETNNGRERHVLVLHTDVDHKFSSSSDVTIRRTSRSVMSYVFNCHSY